MSTIVKIIVGFLVLGALALIGVLVSIYLVNMRGARSNARDARITSDMSMLRSSFELVAAEEGGYSKLSCSYDSEIKAICGDIDSQCTQGNCAGDEAPGGPGDVTIHSSKEAYCAYTPLNEGEYYCIDSTGVEITASNPSAICNQGSFECPGSNTSQSEFPDSEENTEKDRPKVQDSKITSEMGRLRVMAETVFSETGNYKRFACDYDSETQNLCENVEEQEGKVTIWSGKGAYCAYTPLNDGNYYCIGSTGAAGETNVAPSTTCSLESFKCPSELEF